MKRLTIGWLLCLASLSACGSKVPPLTEQEKAVVNELTTEMQPRCVGRYLIDLPAKVLVRGSAKINDAKVEAEAKPLQGFELEMRRREAELMGTKHLEGYQFLRDHGKVRQVEHSRYFVSLRDSAGGDVGRVIEAYKWDRGYQITVRIEAADSIHAEYTKKYQGTPYGISEPRNDVPEKLRLVFDLIERLQGRPENMIPSEPGTCFVGGFLPGKAASEQEDVSTSFALIEKPDTLFTWDSDANKGDEDDTLLPRIRGAAVQNGLKAANGRVLRLGSESLPSGMKVDEALMQALSYAVPNVQGFQFALETNYRGGAQTPQIRLDMKTASPNSLIEVDQIKQSSLSEAEAVAVWDKVSRTLRPRPNAF